jgi:hypothetical protein
MAGSSKAPPGMRKPKRASRTAKAMPPSRAKGEINTAQQGNRANVRQNTTRQGNRRSA